MKAGFGLHDPPSSGSFICDICTIYDTSRFKVMKTLPISAIPAEQLDALDKFAATEAGSELRDVLLSLSRCVRDGDEVVVLDGSATVTPNQAAERLGMSRTHLYKLLDRGEIVFIVSAAIAAFVSQTSLRSRRSASMTAASSPSVSLTRARPVPRRPMRSPICSNAGGSAASCRRRSAGLGMCTTAEPDLPSVYSRRT